MTCIMQDNDGYMWYGTSDGLCRDDGYGIKVIRSDFHTPNVISSNYINTICDDEQGHVWFSTKKGVHILDKRTFRCKRVDIDDLPQHTYTLITHTGDGYVWVGGTSLLYKFKGDGTLLEKKTLKSGVAAFYVDSRDNLFMSVFDDGLYCRARGGDSFRLIVPECVPTCMTEGRRDGEYWLCQEGIYKMRYNPLQDASSASLTRINPPKDHNGKDITLFTGAVQDNNTGLLWLMSYYRGIVLMDEEGKQQSLPEALRDKTSDMMNCLYEDKNGRIWMSGYNTGCYIVRQNHQHVSNVDLTGFVNRTPSVPTIMGFTFDSGGVYWINQDRYGLYLYDAMTHQVNYYRDFPEVAGYELFLTTNVISSSSANSAWLSYYGNRLLKLRREGMKIYVEKAFDLQEMCPTSISCITEDSDGNLWIGSESGLFRYDRNKDKVVPTPVKNGHVVSMVTDWSNGLWYTLADGGLSHLASDGTLSRFAEDTKFSAIDISESGKIWLATNEGRVMAFDLATHLLDDYTQTYGMSGNVVNNIKIDKNNNV